MMNTQVRQSFNDTRANIIGSTKWWGSDSAEYEAVKDAIKRVDGNHLESYVDLIIACDEYISTHEGFKFTSTGVKRFDWIRTLKRDALSAIEAGAGGRLACANYINEKIEEECTCLRNSRKFCGGNSKKYKAMYTAAYGALEGNYDNLLNTSNDYLTTHSGHRYTDAGKIRCKSARHLKSLIEIRALLANSTNQQVDSQSYPPCQTGESKEDSHSPVPTPAEISSPDFIEDQILQPQGCLEDAGVTIPPDFEEFKEGDIPKEYGKIQYQRFYNKGELDRWPDWEGWICTTAQGRECYKEKKENGKYSIEIWRADGYREMVLEESEPGPPSVRSSIAPSDVHDDVPFDGHSSTSSGDDSDYGGEIQRASTPVRSPSPVPVAVSVRTTAPIVTSVQSGGPQDEFSGMTDQVLAKNLQDSINYVKGGSQEKFNECIGRIHKAGRLVGVKTKIAELISENKLGYNYTKEDIENWEIKNGLAAPPLQATPSIVRNVSIPSGTSPRPVESNPIVPRDIPIPYVQSRGNGMDRDPMPAPAQAAPPARYGYAPVPSGAGHNASVPQQSRCGSNPGSMPGFPLPTAYGMPPAPPQPWRSPVQVTPIDKPVFGRMPASLVAGHNASVPQQSRYGPNPGSMPEFSLPTAYGIPPAFNAEREAGKLTGMWTREDKKGIKDYVNRLFRDEKLKDVCSVIENLDLNNYIKGWRLEKLWEEGRIAELDDYLEQLFRIDNGEGALSNAYIAMGDAKAKNYILYWIEKKQAEAKKASAPSCAVPALGYRAVPPQSYPGVPSVQAPIPSQCGVPPMYRAVPPQSYPGVPSEASRMPAPSCAVPAPAREAAPDLSVIDEAGKLQRLWKEATSEDKLPALHSYIKQLDKDGKLEGILERVDSLTKYGVSNWIEVEKAKAGASRIPAPSYAVPAPAREADSDFKVEEVADFMKGLLNSPETLYENLWNHYKLPGRLEAIYSKGREDPKYADLCKYTGADAMDKFKKIDRLETLLDSERPRDIMEFYNKLRETGELRVIYGWMRESVIRYVIEVLGDNRIPAHSDVMSAPEAEADLDQIADLDSLREGIKKIRPLAKVPAEVIDNVSGMVTPMEIGEEYKNKAILRKQYEKINVFLRRAMLVRGDGNCFYRSVMIHMLYQMMTETRDGRYTGYVREMIREWSDKIAEKGTRDAWPEEYAKRDTCNALLEYVESFNGKYNSLNDSDKAKLTELKYRPNGEYGNKIQLWIKKILNDCDQIDKAFIEFIRISIGNYFKAHEDIDMGGLPLSTLLEIDGNTLDGYLGQIVLTMGEDAKDALFPIFAKKFKVNLNIVRVDDKGVLSVIENHSDDDPFFTMDVLLRPGHYDCLMR